MQLPLGVNPVAVRRFTFYLVDRDRDGNKIPDIEFWAREATFLLCLINGGATRLPPAVGTWIVEETNKVVTETVHIVYSAVDPEKFLTQFALVRTFIERFGRQTNQDTVLVEFDGRMYFIPVAGQRLAAQ